jgi:hypothetical protein
MNRRAIKAAQVCQKESEKLAMHRIKMRNKQKITKQLNTKIIYFAGKSS